MPSNLVNQVLIERGVSIGEIVIETSQIYMKSGFTKEQSQENKY